MARLTVRIRFDGTSPLVCHNARMADPDDEFVREIAALTGKRKKTEDDRKEIAKLEWFGGLYEGSTVSGLVIPAANLRRCLVRGGTIHKLGTQFGRAFQFSGLEFALIYDGPRDLRELYKSSKHHYRTSVGVNASRTMRTRPIFPEWAVETEGVLFDDVMDLADLERIVITAGISEGLGDNRINGYGRFRPTMTVIQEA